MRILTVGNSFSDDATSYLYEIAKSAGVDENLYLGNLYVGGCSLDAHIKFFKENEGAYEYRTNVGDGWKTKYGATIFDGLLDGEWDLISFQQASGFSGKATTYEDLEELMELVRSKVGEKPIFAWHMTWAYAQNSQHPHFVEYENSQEKMYGAIVSAVKKKIFKNPKISKIAPCGTAIQNARNTCLGGFGEDLTRDGFHLDLNIGRYIAGLTLAKAFIGVDLSKVTFVPELVTEDMRKIAIDCVQKAFEKMFSETQIEL